MTNDKATTQGIQIPWAGKPVRLEEVETQLVRLWRMSANNMRTAQNLNVRTSVLNLVICTPDIQTAQWANAQLRDLSNTHLARVTIIIFDSDDPTSSVSSWATLRCFPVISDVMRHCFEQITLHITGKAISATEQILRPLLKPDLPVYLWWLGDLPSGRQGFHDLVRLSNRVIVDSDRFFRSEEDIHSVVELMDALPNCAISDLNWGRLTAWRELIAQFFDSSDLRPYLEGLDNIEIEYATNTISQDGVAETLLNPTNALLLVGWMKRTLGWTIDTSHPYPLSDSANGIYQWQLERLPQAVSLADGDSIKITIKPRVHADMAPGTLCLINASSRIQGKQGMFSISRKDDPEHVVTSVILPEGPRPTRTVNMTIYKESRLLHDELEILGHDQLFEEAMHQVEGLL